MLSLWYYWLICFLSLQTYAVSSSVFKSHQVFPENAFDDQLKVVSDSTLPLQRPIVNLTDCVYKGLLRFLKCSTIRGNPYGITLLDPLDFNLDKLADKETIRLSGVVNGTVSRLSQLVINYVVVTIPSYNAKITGNIPRLSVSGEYNVTGVLVRTLPVFGSGTYSIELYNVSFTVDITLKMAKNKTFYMSKFDVNYSPESVQVSTGQLLGGGPLGSTVQDFLQDNALKVVARSRLLVQENIRAVAISAANHQLASLKGLTSLVSFLVKFGNVTTITC